MPTTGYPLLTIGSLFSGIGGLELGLERSTGARTIWQVERDPFCRRVLEKHWPEAMRHDDVTTARDFPFADIICGGFPCQDISVAGAGAGIEHGARSGLWREFARIIGETKPRVVVVENVAVLASRGLSRVLQDLADLGFMGSWDVVAAASVGAPHLRRRLFVVAAHPERVDVRQQPGWRSGEVWARARESRLSRTQGNAADANVQHLDVPARPSGECVPEPARHGVAGNAPHTACIGRRQRRSGDTTEESRGRHADGSCIVADVPHADSPPCEGDRRAVRGAPEHPDADMAGLGWCGWQPASPVRRVDDGIPRGLDRPRRRRPANDKHRLHALGNAVVPQVAEVIGRVVNEFFK